MTPDEQHRIAARLRPLAVRQYAETRGWIRVEGSRRRIWLLRHSVERLCQLQIPMDVDEPGFAEAMLDVVVRLGEVEQRTTDAVLADLQWPDSDVLRVRVANPDAEGGQLSLAADVMLRDGARRALLASACSVVNPVPYHPRLSRSEADAMLAIDRAAQLLRPASKGIGEELFVGTVETLEGTVGPGGRRSGEVCFSLLLPEGEPMRVRAILDPDQYEVAMRAHERGNSYVKLLGVLNRGARVGRLDPLRRLEPWDGLG